MSDTVHPKTRRQSAHVMRRKIEAAWAHAAKAKDDVKALRTVNVELRERLRLLTLSYAQLARDFARLAKETT